jgi:hypothetical protein
MIRLATEAAGNGTQNKEEQIIKITVAVTVSVLIYVLLLS